jgi:large subunit ribosomal protein L17
MRHLVKGRKLNRTASHRRAMLSNLAISILDKERVETTVPKAKEVRRVVERLITYGKKGDLHSRRLAAVRINNPDVLSKLFAVIAPAYKDRNGGYTRVLKTRSRKGDNAPMAIIELVGIGGADTVRKRRKKKKTEQGPGAAKASSAPVKEEKAAESSK